MITSYYDFIQQEHVYERGNEVIRVPDSKAALVDDLLDEIYEASEEGGEGSTKQPVMVCNRDYLFDDLKEKLNEKA